MKAFALLIVAIVTTGAWARELYPGQYAQVPPKVQEWFRNQVVPGGPRKGTSCCSISDGAYAEEDMRTGDDGQQHYWANWCAHKNYETDECIDYSGWQQIPDEVVIHDPNKNGAPVVWFAVRWSSDGKILGFTIHCYSPGAGT